MTTLAFDTATSFGAVCGSRRAVARARRARGDLLAAVDELIDATRREIERIVVGRGPGSFTSIRIGLAMARALALVARRPGRRRLDARRATPAATPVIDARRGEVFTTGPRVCAPAELDVAGRVLVGDGAVRYRELFEARGRDRPARRRPRSSPRPARCSRRTPAPFGDAEHVLPLYVREPDARPQRMTAVALDIRPLELADLGAIETIEQRAYPTPWSRSMFASELAKPTSICLGAFDGAELVGYIINSRYVDAWHVMNVAVDPDHQRRGVATRLLERLFELTIDDERRGYTLEVRVSNEAAIKLYEQLGFEPRGVRRGYYTDNREDALIMWRDARLDRRDPRNRDVVRRDRCGTSSPRTGRSGRASSPRRTSCTRDSAASCPRSRRGATSSSSSPVIREALARRRTPTTSTPSP